MVWVVSHVKHQLVEAGDDGIGHILIKPRPAQNAARALMHHVADDLFIRRDDEAGAVDDAIEQGDMAAFADGGGQCLAEQWRHFHTSQPFGNGGLDHTAQPVIIQTFKDIGEQAGGAIAQTARSAAILTREEAAGRASHIQTAHPPGDDSGGQKVIAQEGGKRVADPILVAGDDGGMWDGQAEGVAEQRGDGKPVGKATDHRRLCKGLHEPDNWMDRTDDPRRHIDARHDDEHASRNHLHLPRIGSRRQQAGRRPLEKPVCVPGYGVTPPVRPSCRTG